jgi:hypothetical protein
MSPAALAGPVTSGSGAASVNFETRSEFLELGSRTFPVTYPGSATHEYNGLIPDNENSSVGGLGRITYDLVDRDDGAAMNVTVSHHNLGDSITQGGSASFSLEFTTDRPLRYRFVADMQEGSPSFDSGLGSGSTSIVHAWGSIIPDVIEGAILEGTIPHDRGSFSTFNQEGVLPAGQYVLFATATSGIEPRGEDAIDSQGSVRFTLLDEAGPTNPVPLPPAVWPALGTMALAAWAAFVRRRRCVAW